MSQPSITAALASSSGSRDCFSCGRRLTDRTVMISFPEDRMVLCVECARELADAINACSGVIKL